MAIDIHFFGSWRNRLGESPLWDPNASLLYWVDSVARRICRADALGGRFETWTLPDVVGSVALAETGLIAAMGDGFYAVDLTTGATQPIAVPECGNAAVRFNDGKADRQGRYLSGTMRIDRDGDAAPGVLYRLDSDGRCAVLDRNIGISNAICFSPDGDWLYFADSLQGVIWRYRYDAVSGAVSDRCTFADARALGSAPDGATVDAEGYVWVALVQSQQVACLAPDGSVTQKIDLPIPFPSCPAFGGANLQTLFITTIADSGHRLRTDHPEGGRMLAIDGLGVCGLPEARCRIDHHRTSHEPRS